MKKLITVKSDLEGFNISLAMENLNNLSDEECNYLLTKLKYHVETYQRHRKARLEFKAAEDNMAYSKEELAQRCPFFYDDLPF